MAVRKVTNTSWYVGLAADAKPAYDATSTPYDSRFLETDTSKTFRLNSAGAWVEYVERVSLPNVEGTPGQAKPSKAVYFGADDGTNLQGLQALNVVTVFNPTLYKGLIAKAALHAYGGTNIELLRNNTEGTLLASAARTATTQSANQTNYNARGVLVTLSVTVASGTGGLKVRIFGIDAATSLGVQLNATPTGVVATGRFVYELYPGITGTGGSAQQRTSGGLPRQWYVDVAHDDASSYTYSVGYALIL